jgi:hypothetical protein
MVVELRLDYTSNQWMLPALEGAYNHVASTNITAYSVHINDALTTEIRTQIGTLS